MTSKGDWDWRNLRIVEANEYVSREHILEPDDVL